MKKVQRVEGKVCTGDSICPFPEAVVRGKHRHPQPDPDPGN
jgi:hypothetical protein